VQKNLIDIETKIINKIFTILHDTKILEIIKDKNESMEMKINNEMANNEMRTDTEGMTYMDLKDNYAHMNPNHENMVHYINMGNNIPINMIHHEMHHDDQVDFQLVMEQERKRKIEEN